jgi:hypothetical protein
VTVRHDPTHLLPTPYQRCAFLDPGIGAAQVYYQVNQARRSLFGFIFTPGAPAGDWWAQVATHTVGPSWLQWNLGDGVACPSSFRFIPT